MHRLPNIRSLYGGPAREKEKGCRGGAGGGGGGVVTDGVFWPLVKH